MVDITHPTLKCDKLSHTYTLIPSHLHHTHTHTLPQAAFLLPVITRMLRDNVPGASSSETQSPEVLIISPTRELTLQIYNEARKFVHETIYRPVVVYGGTSVGHQLRMVERGANIVVGTPGRLLDFLQRKKVGERKGRNYGAMFSVDLIENSCSVSRLPW